MVSGHDMSVRDNTRVPIKRSAHVVDNSIPFVWRETRANTALLVVFHCGYQARAIMSENYSAITRLMYQLFVALGKKTVSPWFTVSPTILYPLVMLTLTRIVWQRYNTEHNPILGFRHGCTGQV